MRSVDQYVLRVLADQWPAPARLPSLLDVSRRGDGIADELARVGFRVTRVTLEDSSLETVGERLAGMHRHFDAVVIRDVLQVVENWREVVSRAARRLRPGGVFVYGVSERTARHLVGLLVPRWIRSWLRPAVPAWEMVALLHRAGLRSREMISRRPGSLEAAAFMGYSVARAEIPSLSATVRWDVTGTGERWLAGARP